LIENCIILPKTFGLKLSRI